MEASATCYTITVGKSESPLLLLPASSLPPLNIHTQEVVKDTMVGY